MKKRFASIASLAVSALLLTSCAMFQSDGNWGSEYYDTAKSQAASAGLEGKLIAGKRTSGNDFVTMEYKDITGAEMVAAATALAKMSVPPTANRTIKWEGADKSMPSTLEFDSSNPDMDKIKKFAQTWDENKEYIAFTTYNLNLGNRAESSSKSQILFDLKNNTSVPDIKKVVNNIKFVTGQPTTELSSNGFADKASNIYFAVTTDKINLSAVKGSDDTDKVIDVAAKMLTLADEKKSSYPNVKDYKVSIWNHMAAIGSNANNFYAEFKTQSDDNSNENLTKSYEFEREVAQSFQAELTALGY